MWNIYMLSYSVFFTYCLCVHSGSQKMDWGDENKEMVYKMTTKSGTRLKSKYQCAF